MDGADSSEAVVSEEGREDVGADQTEEMISSEPADADQIGTPELPSGEGQTEGEQGEIEAGGHEVGEEGATHPMDNGQEVRETEGGEVEVMTEPTADEEKEGEGKGEEEEREAEGRVEEESQKEKADEEQEISYDYEELKSEPEAVNLSTDISLKLQYPSQSLV